MSKKGPSKTPAAESAKVTISDNELTFLLPAKGIAAEKINQKVAGAILKTRTEAKLIILGGAEEVKQLPEVLTLSERGRCWLADDITDPAVNSGAFVYMIDDVEAFNPQLVVSAFTLLKKSAQAEGAVYAGIFTPQSGKLPLGFFQKTGISLYNMVAGMFVPAGITDYTHDFVFFTRDFIEGHFSQLNNSAIKLLCRAAYLNIPVTTFVLSIKEHAQRKISWKKIAGNIIAPRINWFVKDPLKHFTAEDEAGRQPLYRLLFFALFIFTLFAMPYFSQDFGITWDAKRHNQYGYQMLNYFTTMGSDTTALAANSPIQEFRYYGEHFNVIAAFFNTYIKVLGEFEMRHLLNALYGLLAMLFAALCAKEIGSWRAGFFALLLVFCSPVFFGQSMNNPTDIPFAAGSAMALYYLLKVLKKLPSPSLSHLFLCGAGIGMAIGSRVGGIIWFAYTGLFLGISWLIIMKKQGLAPAIKLIWPYAKILLTIVAAGYLIGISLWPFALQKPFTNWYVALKQSTEGAYFTYNHELFEGVRMYMANVPWYYLPKFIYLNTPEAVWVGIALLFLTFFAWKKLFSRWYLLLVVIFVAVFPIAYAEVQSMYYYNGWRHYLFVYPPIIVLTAVGWDALSSLLKNRMAQYLPLLAVMGLCALPLSWMIKNHPNECVYFNHISGGTKAAYGKYEMDYYSNSCRAAAEWLVNKEPSAKVVVGINNEPLTASYYTGKTNPNMEFRWLREYEEQRTPWDYAIITSRTYSSKELDNGSFPPKGTIHTIEADGVPLAAVVKRENSFMPSGYQAFDQRKFDTAALFFNQAAAYNPKDEETFRMLGQSYLSLGNASEAVKNFNKAIELFPENYMAWSGLGLVELNINRNYDKALEFFKKANSFKFNYADAYYYSGMALYQKGDFAGGLKYLEFAVKRGGGSIPDLYYSIALGYYNSGNNKKAEDNLLLALSLNQNYGAAYLLLAEVFNKQGKTNEAQACMQRYQQLGGR